MPLTEAEILERVRAFIVETYLYARPDATVGADDALLGSGIIDSLGVMELVAFLERTFGVPVAPEEITEQHFATLGAIARFVRAKGGAGG